MEPLLVLMELKLQLLSSSVPQSHIWKHFILQFPCFPGNFLKSFLILLQKSASDYQDIFNEALVSCRRSEAAIFRSVKEIIHI